MERTSTSPSNTYFIPHPMPGLVLSNIAKCAMLEFYFLLSVCDSILYLVFKTLCAPFANVGVTRFFYPGCHKFVLFKP